MAAPASQPASQPVRPNSVSAEYSNIDDYYVSSVEFLRNLAVGRNREIITAYQ
jgi:hypothetical protein